MPCFHPIDAFRSRDRSEGGKFRITFKRHNNWQEVIKLPCGQCIGCRLERSRQWAVRIMHEAQLHERNCFITLTYSPEHLPSDGGLVKKHVQDFFKRLRKRFSDKKIRYFVCGEYGENYLRPHYHAIVFGLDFEDKEFYKDSGAGGTLYTSAILDAVWSFGHCIIGDVTFESAAYCARYCLKKVNGRNADKHYERFDSLTGEIFSVSPEFVCMSLKPGIGRKWFDKYQSDVFPSDEVISRGFPAKPPRYYDKIFEQVNPESFLEIHYRRARKASTCSDNATPDRLKVREAVTKSRISMLSRNLEN